MQLDQAKLERYLTQFTGRRVQVEGFEELGGEKGTLALKAFGYGQPLEVLFRSIEGGRLERVVLRRITPNAFGHERDSDRLGEVWQDYLTFNLLPNHVRAVDVVAHTDDGALESLGKVRDMFLLTEYASGRPYAEDLIRIRDSGERTELDLRRAGALGTYLAGIHALKHDDPALWRRRLRDLVGHGEGIMGLADSYPTDFPQANGDDLRALEDAANAWRWKLKPRAHRLSQVHGDFHPFNVLFTEGANFNLLDRSRGEWGEPADDVSCMAINYLFFSVQRHHHRLEEPFEALHAAFWEAYTAGKPDEELCEVIQPWYAWRALVVANPVWYPNLEPIARTRLLSFARRVMREDRFDWHDVNRYLEG